MQQLKQEKTAEGEVNIMNYKLIQRMWNVLNNKDEQLIKKHIGLLMKTTTINPKSILKVTSNSFDLLQ